MLKTFLFTVLFFSCLLGEQSAFAQQIKYKYYSVDDGLAQNSVWDAIIDHKGFLWVATSDGINRFDGDKMAVYKGRDNAPSMIGSDYYYHFYQDAQNVLWLCSTKGFGFYNPIIDDFISLRVSQEISTIMGKPIANELWVMEGGKQVLIVDTRKMAIVDSIPINCPASSAASMQNAVDLPNHFVVVLGSNYVLVINKKSRANKLLFNKEDNGSHILAVNDSTVLSIIGDKRFVYKVSESIIDVHSEKRKSLLNVDRITDAESWQGNFIVTSAYGLFILDSKTLEFTKRIPEPHLLGRESIVYYQSIYKDNRGNLFLGTNGAGLRIWSPFNNKFKHYNSPDEGKNMLKSFCKMPNNLLLTGVHDKGILAYYLDFPDSIKHNYKGLKNKINTVTSILPLTSNKVAFSSFNQILLWDTKVQKITKSFVRNKDITNSFQQFSIHDGENYFSYDSLKTSTIATLDEIKGVKVVLKVENRQTTSFLPIGKDGFLLGSRNGLFHYSVKSKKDTALAVKGFVKSILKTTNNEYYVATLSGLYHLDSQFRKVQFWNEKDGLVNCFLYGVLEDEFGRLWMSHNKGISCLDNNTKTFKNYGIADGLQSNEFNTGAFYKDEKGLLYFGGINGFNIIDPAHILEDKKPIAVAINQIKIDDLPLQSDTNYNEIRGLILGYQQNTFSINFSALEFVRPEACKYKYKLQGYDPNWIQSGAINFARYANVPPGEYMFMVVAANPDGYWNKTPKAIKIIIKAPFWKTLWFSVLLIALLLILMLGIGNSILLKQRKKELRKLEIQKNLEEERIRISRDLHDNVGAHISFLINNLDWMQENPKGLPETERIAKLKLLSESGRNAMQTLRQTIWAFSHSSVNADDFADRFKQFVLKMLELNEDDEVVFIEEIKMNVAINPVEALSLFRICQEAFNNALKHALATEIVISFFSNENGSFAVEIKDNGKGFDQKNNFKNDSYGLQNMELRAKEINAEILIVSAINIGTMVKIILKN